MTTHYREPKRRLDYPFIINKQIRVIEPTVPTDGDLLFININIPTSWKQYDLIISGETYVDEIEIYTGVLIDFYFNQEKIGSQLIGYNNLGNDIGLSGYHQEIINELNQTGEIRISLRVRGINTLNDQVGNLSVINTYLHLQAIRIY